MHQNYSILCNEKLGNQSNNPYICSGGSKGVRGMRSPPFGPKCLDFHAVFRKNWPNNRLAPPFVLAPPPLGNPGSATDLGLFPVSTNRISFQPTSDRLTPTPFIKTTCNQCQYTWFASSGIALFQPVNRLWKTMKCEKNFLIQKL